MNILFYQPYSQAVPYIESVVEQFGGDGHNLFFVSHSQPGQIHENLKRIGCKVYSLPIKRKSIFHYYWNRISGLVKFCNRHEIEVVYSHFQEANLIAVLAQYFCSATFVITRHHSDCAFIDNNWREKWGDRIINRLAKVYIAPSYKVLKQIVEIERAKPSKVKLINYGYNFDNLPVSNTQKIDEIKRTYPARILLIKAARFIPEKRHALVIESIKELVDLGYDIKLLLLGNGPLQDEIKVLIRARRLEDRVFPLGFQQNIMDYFAAADLVVHFSVSEASNSAIKEAAITDTPVAVCRDVGDFDDYIVHEKNGFLLSKMNPESDFKSVISKTINQGYDLKQMGRQLHIDVVRRFDIKNVVEDYRTINLSFLDGTKK